MSDIAVIGAGYVGLTDRRLLRAPRVTTSCAPTSTRSGCGRCRRARCRSSRRVSPRSSPRAWRRAGCGSSSARSDAARRRRVRVPLRADPAVGLRRRRPLLRRRRRAGDRAGAAAGHGRREQVDHAGRLHRLVARALKRAGRVTDVGVASNPEFLREGTRGPRLPRRRTVWSSAATTPRSRCGCRELYRDVAGADPRHRPRVGGDDQVRVERVPRHEDLLRQRDRQPVRGGERRRARGRARHGLRPAHRVRVPAPRVPATAARASRRTPPRSSTRPTRRATTSSLLRSGDRRQRPAARPRSSTRSAPRRAGSLDGATRRRVGAHVQGQHRRPPRLAGAVRRRAACSTKARRSSAYDPAAGETAATRLSRPRRRRPMPYEAAAGAPSPRAAHRVGRVPLARLRPRARRRWRRRTPSSTPATSSTRRRCAAAGFAYQGVGR